MAFSDYSITPSANTSLAGINVAEGCPAGNINGVIRQLAADGKQLSVQVSGAAQSMPVSGGIFTGPIFQFGRGGYLHNNDPSNAGGRVFIQATGGAPPAMSNGDWLLEY